MGQIQPSPMQPGPIQMGPMQIGQMQPDHIQIGQMQPGPIQIGQTQIGPIQIGQIQIGQIQPDQIQIGQTQIGQGQPDQIQIGQGQMQPGQIQIGDYVDITSDNIIERYYVIKIVDDTITIVGLKDNPTPHQLIKVNGVWLMKNHDIDEISNVMFIKNETRYLERDFTQTPTKIINFVKYGYYPWKEQFTELKNGIILHSRDRNSNHFHFFDPNNAAKCFLELSFGPLWNDPHNKTINLDGEIFVYNRYIESIVKLNLNDGTFTEYDKNSNYKSVYALNNKKILCIPFKNNAYILDVANNTKTIIEFEFSHDYLIYSVWSGIIILVQDTNIILPLKDGDLYRLNIENGNMIKIASFNRDIKIVSPLKDNKILMLDSNEIQIWTIINDKITEKLTIFSNPNSSNPLRLYWHPFNVMEGTELLQNGDVLFIMNEVFYLFNYVNKQIIKLTSFDEVSIHCSFRELKNGNILITNGEFLRILEFPISQREIDRISYDNISSSIVLNPDMKELVKAYL